MRIPFLAARQTESRRASAALRPSDDGDVDLFGQLIELTRADFQHKLLEHSLAGMMRDGSVKLGHYRAYLRETWHLVRHTPAIFELGAARVPDSRPGLCAWMLEQAAEERGHDQLCARDLRRVGGDCESLPSGRPGVGVWGLVTQDYYYALQGNPAGLLGTASLSEELGATLAEPAARALLAALHLPRAALGFIIGHGNFDQKHFEDARRAVNSLLLPDEFEELLHARRMAIAHCAQLLTDIIATPG